MHNVYKIENWPGTLTAGHIAEGIRQSVATLVMDGIVSKMKGYLHEQGLAIGGC